MVGTITSGIDEYYEMFFSSRRVEGVTESTLLGYERKYRFISRGLDLSTATRQIIYASRGEDFAEAARRVASELRQQINRYRASPTL